MCLVGFVSAYDDGSYRGEGLLESQDFGQYNPAQVGVYATAYGGVYGISAQDGSYKGEGLLESQDVGQYNPIKAGVYATPYGGVVGVAQEDGSYKGEGLLESQDYGQYNPQIVAAYAGVPAVSAYAGYPALAAVPVARAIYAHAGAPIGLDGRVVDTPEVAIAKAAHFAAKAAALH